MHFDQCVAHGQSRDGMTNCGGRLKLPTHTSRPAMVTNLRRHGAAQPFREGGARGAHGAADLGTARSGTLGRGWPTGPAVGGHASLRRQQAGQTASQLDDGKSVCWLVG